MRTALSLMTVALLIGLSHPAFAECYGEGLGTVCIDENGESWTAVDDYFGDKSGGSKIAKYPNASAGSWNSSPAPPPDPNAKTIVLTPGNQSGNAWVVTPQSNGGAAVCGSGASC